MPLKQSTPPSTANAELYEDYFIKVLEHNQSTDTRDTAIVACNRLQAVRLQDNECETESVYAETYNIYINFHSAKKPGVQSPNGTCEYNIEEYLDMFAEQLSYVLCIKDGLVKQNNAYGFKRRFIKLWHNDLLPYNVRESLLFSLSGDPQHMLNIVGNAHDIVKSSNMTARAAMLQYMSQLQEFNYSRLSTTEQSPLAVHGEFPSLRKISTQNWSKVVLHVAHDCYKYCGRSKIYDHYGDVTKIALSASDTFSADIDSSCAYYIYGQQDEIAAMLGGFISSPPLQNSTQHSEMLTVIILLPVLSAIYAVISLTRVYIKEIREILSARTNFTNCFTRQARN